MKHHLRRIVSVQILSFEELNTLVILRAILNSRPLSALSSDPNDLQPITPAHFFMGKSAKDLSTARQSDGKVDLGHLNDRRGHFWKAWYRDYLVTLHIRKRWLQSGPNSLGDLVLVAEDNMPPLRWKMARIEQLYSGNDDINRVAELRRSSGHIIRP